MHNFEFLPAGLATGIGSMPGDAAGAARLVTQTCPQLPFWPQLPSTHPHEAMLAQPLAPLARLLAPRPGGLPGFRVLEGAMGDLLAALTGGPAELPASHAAGLAAFTRQAGAGPAAIAVKGQLTGPVTLAAAIVRGPGTGRVLLEHPALREAVSRYLGRLARWQVRALAPLGRPVMVWLDEPVLAHVHRLAPRIGFEAARAMLAPVFEAIRAEGALAGLHTCAPAQRHWFTELRPDVLSFDAGSSLDGLAGGPARDFIETGGMLAFGLAPPRPSRTRAELLFVRWLEAAGRVGHLRALARRTLVTPTCGLGLVDEPSARRALELATETGAMIRRVALGQVAACAPGGRPRREAGGD